MTNSAYSVSIDGVAVATAVANSQTIGYVEFQSGSVHVPSGSALTTLTYHTSLKPDGPYIAAFNDSNAAVTRTVAAGRSYPIPDVLRGARFIRITGNAAGSVGLTLKTG